MKTTFLVSASMILACCLFQSASAQCGYHCGDQLYAPVTRHVAPDYRNYAADYRNQNRTPDNVYYYRVPGSGANGKQQTIRVEQYFNHRGMRYGGYGMGGYGMGYPYGGYGMGGYGMGGYGMGGYGYPYGGYGGYPYGGYGRPYGRFGF